VPSLRRRFLVYGSRATAPTPSTPSSSSSPPSSPSPEPNKFNKLLDYAASIQVPHNYFTHFYLLSLTSSLFWGSRLSLWRATTSPQVRIAWGLMLLQGVRRLLEAYAYTSNSKSKMWFAHWLLGLLFYLFTNIAIWIEHEHGDIHSTDAFPPPSSSSPTLGWKAVFLIPAILTAHVLQHTYHAYLYNLRMQSKGYQLPSHPWFPNLLCPHYTCEVAIYVGLCLLAAPEGRWVNGTVGCAAVFVAVNLGVTAWGTREWYVEKFGEGRVGARRRMVPGVW
jgi:3-oxo-5-alpha-steroid 4-dehydrogenase 3